MAKISPRTGIAACYVKEVVDDDGNRDIVLEVPGKCKYYLAFPTGYVWWILEGHSYGEEGKEAPFDGEYLTGKVVVNAVKVEDG